MYVMMAFDVTPFIGTRGRVEIRGDESTVLAYYEGLIESVDADTIRVIPAGLGGMVASYPSDGRVTIAAVRDIEPL